MEDVDGHISKKAKLVVEDGIEDELAEEELLRGDENTGDNGQTADPTTGDADMNVDDKLLETGSQEGTEPADRGVASDVENDDENQDAALLADTNASGEIGTAQHEDDMDVADANAETAAEAAPSDIGNDGAPDGQALDGQAESAANDDDQAEAITNDDDQAEAITNDDDQAETITNDDDQAETTVNYQTVEEQTGTTANDDDEGEPAINDDDQAEPATNDDDEGEAATIEDQTETTANDDEPTTTEQPLDGETTTTNVDDDPATENEQPISNDDADSQMATDEPDTDADAEALRVATMKQDVSEMSGEARSLCLLRALMSDPQEVLGILGEFPEEVGRIVERVGVKRPDLLVEDDDEDNPPMDKRILESNGTENDPVPLDEVDSNSQASDGGDMEVVEAEPVVQVDEESQDDDDDL